MSLGCIQLLSDQTPWNDLAKADAGCISALNDDAAFISCLSQIAMLDQDSFDRMSQNAYTFAKNIINNKEILDQNRSLFK
jgi:hypothetical protein